MSTTRRIEVAPGIELYTQVWEPQGPPRFVVVVAHGQGEYVSRYDQLARELNEAGALVFGPDHRGQGRSGGPPGYVERFEDYAADLRKVIGAVSADLPAEAQPDRLPWFVFGHSMGGLIGLIFALDHGARLPLRGLVVSNPMLVPNAKGAAIKKILGKVLVRFAPKLQIPINLDRSLLFRDEARLAEYLKDQTGVDPLTPMFGEAFAAAVERIYAETKAIELPMLWMVGTGDRIIAPQPTIDLFRGLPSADSKDRTMEIFDGYYHEMHNEPPELRQHFVERLISWMRERA